MRAVDDGAPADLESASHLGEIPTTHFEQRDERGLDTVPIAVGGIIPEHDRTALLEMGVVAIFGPGSRTEDIKKALEDAVAAFRRGQA